MSYYISDHGKDCTCWTCNFGRNKEFFELIHQQKSRIAELEAEVERLKAFCNEWVYNEETFQKESAVEICPIITEEGQG